MKAAIDKAIKDIKDAGFGFMKFELEGQIGRRGVRMVCNDCTRGHTQCSACSATGVITLPPNNRFSVETTSECSRCQGEGDTICSSCNGQGSGGDWGNNEACEKFMLDYVLRKLHNTTYAKMREANPIKSGKGAYSGMPNLTYGKFYVDGSVDSEYTFTIPTENVTDVPIYIEAFDALSKKIRNGKPAITAGAGMHIAVLPSQNRGVYPGVYQMPEDKVSNFTNEMTKLLPALFFVATASHQSRPMNYRVPRVSRNDKYSAIYTQRNTCFEYRVFETCYERPEAVLDFVKIIAKSLKFYADPSLKVKAIGKTFGFADTRNIADCFDTPEQLRILNATVKYLKPEDKTFKQLKSERGLTNYSIKSLSTKQKVRISGLRKEWEEYEKRYKQIQNKPLTPSEKRDVDYMMLDGISHADAVLHVRGQRQSKIVDFAKFAKDNISKRRRIHAITI